MKPITVIPESSIHGRCEAFGYCYGSLRAELQRGALPFLARYRGIRHAELAAHDREALELYFRLCGLGFSRKGAERLATIAQASLAREVINGTDAANRTSDQVTLRRDAASAAIELALGDGVLVMARASVGASA